MGIKIKREVMRLRKINFFLKLALRRYRNSGLVRRMLMPYGEGLKKGNF
jgi:hypothetical protein